MQLVDLRRLLYQNHLWFESYSPDVRFAGKGRTCFTLLHNCLLTIRVFHRFFLSKEGFTALIAASSAGHLDCVKLLLDHGAEVNTADPVSIAAHDRTGLNMCFYISFTHVIERTHCTSSGGECRPHSDCKASLGARCQCRCGRSGTSFYFRSPISCSNTILTFCRAIVHRLV